MPSPSKYPPDPVGRSRPVDFAPGQITILANHRRAQLRPEEIAQAIRSHPLFADGPLYEAEVSVDRIVSFERGSEAPPFSLIYVHIPSLYEVDKKYPQQLIDLIDLINTFNEQLDFQDSFGALELIAAGPNWLSSGAGDHEGGGGPGGKPVQEQPAPGGRNPHTGRFPWEFDLPLERPDRPGEGIQVAILDTAPCLHDLAEAYQQWRTTNPLIASLLQPGGRLRVSYAAYADLVRLADFSLEEHKYRMADHGLFVAGVIHSIAPYADLHLIEVLNSYGGGTLETIARGFEQVLKERDPNRPLVVNCSLVVNIPREDLLLILQAQDPVYQRIDQAKLDIMSQPVRAIFDLLRQTDGRQPNVCIVAAAGNDADLGKLPLPRYPAAFDNVLGVGALTENNQPAVYSNKSDDPLSAGIATFGGDTIGVRPDREAKSPGGMLGIYSGVFPGASPGYTRRNNNGWARWAGTSFATPVVSGALAMRRSAVADFPTAIKELRNVPDSGSAIGEVFPISQG